MLSSNNRKNLPIVACPRGQCELRTLPASQLGTFCALLVSLAFYFREANRNLTGQDKQFNTGFLVIFFSTFVYYFVAEWMIEETTFSDLRKLRWPQSLNWIPLNPALVEFLLRTSVAVLAILSTSLPDSIYQHFGFKTRFDWGLICMMTIYGVFLFWDALVFFCGQPQVVQSFFFFDVICGGFVCLCIWGHIKRPDLGLVAATCLAAAVAHLILKEHMLESFSRLFRGRHFLR